jgi:hypothetical protein
MRSFPEIPERLALHGFEQCVVAERRKPGWIAGGMRACVLGFRG